MDAAAIRHEYEARKAQIWGGASGEIPDSAWELEAGEGRNRSKGSGRDGRGLG